MNIYVSNLSFHTSEADLNTLFSKFGTVVSSKIIMDRTTNRSRGFGFIEMPSEEEGQAALYGLNNTEIEGRKLFVSVAKQEKRASSNRFF